MLRRALFVGSLALSLAAGAQPQEDPVLRARTQRASALGIAEGDLPPVPRGIVEPPPLPPPEAHLRDTPKGQKAKAKGKAKKSKTAATKGKAKAKAPAKGKTK